MRLGETNHIACNHDTKGSKVKIRQLGEEAAQKFPLCEVEVFGERGKKILISINARLPTTTISLILYAKSALGLGNNNNWISSTDACHVVVYANRFIVYTLFLITVDMRNLARAKPAQLRTTSDWHKHPVVAVDGMKTENGYTSTNAWWMVDLEAYYLIWEVVVTEKSEGCCRRFNSCSYVKHLISDLMNTLIVSF